MIHHARNFKGAHGLAIAVSMAPASYARRETNCSVRTVIDDVPNRPFMYFMTVDEARCLQPFHEADVDDASRGARSPDRTPQHENLPSTEVSCEAHSRKK